MQQFQKACATSKYSLKTLETLITVLITVGKQGLGIDVVKKVLTIDHNMIVQRNPNTDNKIKSSAAKKHTTSLGIEITIASLAKRELFSFSAIFLYRQSQFIKRNQSDLYKLRILNRQSV